MRVLSSPRRRWSSITCSMIIIHLIITATRVIPRVIFVYGHFRTQYPISQRFTGWGGCGHHCPLHPPAVDAEVSNSAALSGAHSSDWQLKGQIVVHKRDPIDISEESRLGLSYDMKSASVSKSPSLCLSASGHNALYLTNGSTQKRKNGLVWKKRF